MFQSSDNITYEKMWYIIIIRCDYKMWYMWYIKDCDYRIKKKKMYKIIK